jgi:hypothetical protein
VGTAIGFNFRSFVRDLKTNGWLIHHEGKNSENGALGSIYIANDTDTELNLKHDHIAEVLAVMVEKCRWGERFRVINFGTRKVPGLKIEGWDEPGEFVAVYELAAGDPKKLVKVARTKEQAKAQHKAQDDREHLDLTLYAVPGREALTTRQLAERCVGPQEDGDTDQQYRAKITRWVDKLKNWAKRDATCSRLFEMVEEGDPPREVRRWFMPIDPPVVAASITGGARW